MVLLGNVAVDDAIRLVGVELSRSGQSVVLGNTPAEKELLERHSAKGKQRSSLGFLVGGSAMGALWRWSGNKRRVLGGLSVISGGIFGMTYGLLSIRRDLFSELLTLPADRSPFAARARKVLQEKLPNNEFVQELRERMKNTASSFDDTWDAAAEAAAAFPPLPSAPRQSGKDTPTISVSIGSSPTASNDSDAFSDAPESSSRTPFFVFGARQNQSDSEDKDRDLPPLSRDPYAAYPSNESAHRAQPRYGRDMIKRDEDEYFFGVPSDREEPVRATTWDEIRRRAAQGENERK